MKSDGTERQPQTSSRLGVLVKGGLTFLISFLMIFGVVQAGSLTPSADPAPTGYTLSGIYARLTTGEISTEAEHVFSPSGSPGDTLNTLSEIYTAIPTIDPATVLSGNSYLGIDGTWNAGNLDPSVVGVGVNYGVSSTGSLVPSGGTATTAGVCNNLTFYGADQSDWAFQTGTLNPSAGTILNGTTICGVSGTVITNPLYGGDVASKVLTTAANPGTYDATNLVPENVRNGITFGDTQTGTFAGNLAYGDDNPDNVLTLAATPGHYNVTTLSNSVIKQGITWGVDLGSTGTLTPNGGTAAVADLFKEKTANLTADWTLDTGTLNLACDTAIFDGTGNLVADAYDGAGDGTNRWCITSNTNSATASQILSGYKSWANGIELTGNIPTHTLSDATTTLAAGYYTTTTLDAVDTDLAAGNIKSGATIFGITGTVKTGVSLGNMFNGSCNNPETCPLGTESPGGSQAAGGVDDFNGSFGQGYTPPPDRYASTWLTCTFDNTYCGTGNAGANAEDTATGLVWSYLCHDIGCSSWDTSAPDFTNCQPSGACNYKANDTYYDWDDFGINNNSSTAPELCSNNPGWSLPHQKQLMQAYIDGSYGNLEPVGAGGGTSRVYWSDTAVSLFPTSFAYMASLSLGISYLDNKSNSRNVRCVRSAP